MMKVWPEGVRWGAKADVDLGSGERLEVEINPHYFMRDDFPQLVFVRRIGMRGVRSICWSFASGATHEELEALGQTLLDLCEIKRGMK